VRPTDRRIVPVRYRTRVRVFEREGFSISRTKGDHIVMTKPGIRRPVVIPSSPRMVEPMLILSNMRTAGMSRQRYFQLLDGI
jgi:predicted RNA binding protein YcfA (HicA-like mRNA interferase family)